MLKWFKEWLTGYKEDKIEKRTQERENLGIHLGIHERKSLFDFFLYHHRGLGNITRVGDHYGFNINHWKEKMNDENLEKFYKLVEGGVLTVKKKGKPIKVRTFDPKKGLGEVKESIARDKDYMVVSWHKCEEEEE